MLVTGRILETTRNHYPSGFPTSYSYNHNPYEGADGVCVAADGPGRGISLRDGVRDCVEDDAPKHHMEYLRIGADQTYDVHAQDTSPQQQSIMLARYMQE